MKKVFVLLGIVSITLLTSCGLFKKDPITITNPQYALYNETAVQDSNKATVLFFHADWCATCRKAEKAINDGTIPENIQFLKVDFDTNETLKEKYGVTSQTTFVQVDTDGNMIKKWEGGKDIMSILENIDMSVLENTDTPKNMNVEDTIEKETMIEESTDMKDENSTDTVQEDPEDNMEKNTDDTMEKEVAKNGSYEAYSAEKVAGATGKIVLFFHANWCPACRAGDSNLSSETIPEGLTILKVDYDNSSELQKKYEVTSQHTFVQIDAEGNMIKKWLGGKTVADIQGELQ